MRLCPKCNIECKKEHDKCPLCGGDIVETNARARVSNISLINIPKKAVVITLSALAVALVLVVSVVIILMNLSSSEQSLVMKDGDLYICTAGDEPTVIEKDIFKGLFEDTLDGAKNKFKRDVFFDREREIIIYPTDFEIINEMSDILDTDVYSSSTYYDVITYSLKYKIKLSDLSGNKRTVCEEAFDFYYIAETGNIFYREGSSLYSYSVTEDSKKKLCGNIQTLNVNEENGNFMVFTEDEKILFGNTDSVYDIGWKYDDFYSAVPSLVMSYTLGSMAYVNESGELYFVSPKEGETKVADGVGYIYSVYDTGEIYYSRYEKFFAPCIDFIEDDCTSKPSAQSTEEARIRYWLSGDPGNYFYKITVYYYDGEKEIQLSEPGISTSQWGYVDVISSRVDIKDDTPLIFYNRAFQKNKEKVYFTDLLYYNNFSEYMWEYQRDALMGERESIIAYKGNTVKCDEISFTDVYSNSTEDTFYFMSGTQTTYDSVYKSTLKDGVMSEPELVYEKVYNINTRVLENGELLYFKNYGSHNKSGDMYVGDKLIDEAVRTENVFEIDDTLYWICDYNWREGSGTLMMLKDGEIKPVAYKVNAESLTECGHGVSFTVSEGEESVLYFFGGRKIKILDRNIDFIIG